AVLAGALGGFLFHSLLFVLLGAALILGAAAEYLFPIRYRLTSKRACASYGLARLEIEWERVRRADWGADAVKLSPFKIPNRLDGLRGVILRFDQPDRAAIMEMVREQTSANT